MRTSGLLVALWAAAAVVWPAPRLKDDPQIYKERREKLRKALADGVTVLFGRTERDSDDLRSGFFQEPNFYYLTGRLEPGAILVLTPSREILFLPRHNPEREKWTGPKTAPGDANIQQITGFETVLASEAFETEFGKTLERHARIYALAMRPEAEKLKTLAPLREIFDAALAIARLRMSKSAEEIALLERAADVTMEAHRAAWKRAAPGVFEYQVATAMMSLYLDQGCERSAYAPIVGSGPNAVALHYSSNSRRMDRGELLLMDVGAECSGYAADITRTIPVDGRFTKRQREIYEIVLGAHNAVIAAIKPGVTIGKSTPNSLYRIAYDYINSHGKDRQGERLGRYFTHGISHHVGLEVHDAQDAAAPLEEGMVITVEPGIYIPEEDIGVRIEDMVLVTRDGSRVLTAALPKEPGEIEKALSK